MQDEKGRTRMYLLPDGLESPKFRRKQSGRGSYIILWKDALDEFTSYGMSICSYILSQAGLSHTSYCLKVAINAYRKLQKLMHCSAIKFAINSKNESFKNWSFFWTSPRQTANRPVL
jgi:hypothetical protein